MLQSIDETSFSADTTFPKLANILHSQSFEKLKRLLRKIEENHTLLLFPIDPPLLPEEAENLQ